MTRSSTQAVAVVSQLAAGQWGLMTTAQAQRVGVSRLQLARLADAGVLERVDHGVYATTAAANERQALRAAWLALDPARTAEERLADPITAGVVSHTSAAALHRLGDLLDDTPEITLPERKQTRRGTRLHRAVLTDADVTIVDGLPTTTEERTVADLLRDGHDGEHVAQIIGAGTRRGVIDLDDLAVRLESSARRYGQPDGRALVEHLLDLVGLSPTALVRELADTPTGRELVATGAATVLSQLMASLQPQHERLPTAQITKLLEQFAASTPVVDVGKLVDVERLAEAVQPLQAQLAAVRSPAVTAALRQLADPQTKAAIEAASALVSRGANR